MLQRQPPFERHNLSGALTEKNMLCEVSDSLALIDLTTTISEGTITPFWNTILCNSTFIPTHQSRPGSPRTYSIPSVPAALQSSQMFAEPTDCEPQSQEHEDVFEDHRIGPWWSTFRHHSIWNKHVVSRHPVCIQSIDHGIAVWLLHHSFGTRCRIVVPSPGRSVAKCHKGRCPIPTTRARGYYQFLADTKQI